MKATVWKLVRNLLLVFSTSLFFSPSVYTKPREYGAATPVQVIKPAPATPIDAKKIELGGNIWDPI